MKYIIDIPDQIAEVSMNYWKKVGFLGEPYVEPDIKAIEDKVWNFVKILENETSVGDLVEMYEDEDEIYMNHTYQEAKARYEAWKKQKDKIYIGDEMYCYDNDSKCVITSIDGERCVSVMWDDGSVGRDTLLETLKKTGRHFDEIEALMKKMMEDE